MCAILSCNIVQIGVLSHSTIGITWIPAPALVYSALRLTFLVLAYSGVGLVKFPI